MQRVLVTGADGFVASHLIRELERETGCDLAGIGLKPRPSADTPGLDYRVLDITDLEGMRALLEELCPDAVFHLAAQPSVARSWEDPWLTYRVNLLGQVNLMEAAHGLGLETAFHVACSSEEYGKVTSEAMPLTEAMPLRPCSHYAVSKVGQEVLGFMYHEAFGTRVVVTRGFNQAGPGQSPDFVVSSFAQQISMIEAGCCAPVLKVGNLDARRDFMDVRDTVRAYRLVMEKGTAGTAYNVCSGTARTVRELLDILLGLAKVDVSVESDPCRGRPSDIPLLVGDSSLLKEETGWGPLIPIERTLEDTLEYWRERAASGGEE